MSVALQASVLITLLIPAAFGQIDDDSAAPKQAAESSARPAAIPPPANDPASTTPKNSPAAGRTFALIVCGHPGDQEHLDRFAESVSRIRTGLIQHYGVAADQISVIFGEGAESLVEQDSVTAEQADTKDAENKQVSTSESDWRTNVPAATQENLKQELDALKMKVTKIDTLWVIAMGHSHHDRGRTWYNLAGEDLQQNQFAALFVGIQAASQTFFVTIPASGFYVRPLSGKGRTIIAATEAGLEINETLFPHALAECIASPPRELPDVDGDGKVSLLDLYVAVTTNVANRYADSELLSTEHAMLEDNGDGRGTEIQVHFLPEDRGGLPQTKQRKTFRAGRDGAAATAVVFSSLDSSPAAASVPPTAE